MNVEIMRIIVVHMQYAPIHWGVSTAVAFPDSVVTDLFVLVCVAISINSLVTIKHKYLDVDECAIGKNNCSTGNTSICTNTEGSYYCNCAAGYNASDTICEGMCLTSIMDIINAIINRY